MRVMDLKERPDLLPQLESWFLTEWSSHYGPVGAGDARADLLAGLAGGGLPRILLALSDSGDLMGTAALRDESFGAAPGEGPWLGGLLVAPPWRGAGIGSTLVSAVEHCAAQLGYQWIYCSTDQAGALLRRRDWQEIGRLPSGRGPLVKFRKALPVLEMERV